MNTDVSPERLRLAERLLIGAASARKELMIDEHWQACMTHIYELIKTVETEPKRKKKHV